MAKQVLHRQVYKSTPFGSGVMNTTYCGRVRNNQDYNVALEGEEVTCHFCKKAISQRGEPKQYNEKTA